MMYPHDTGCPRTRADTAIIGGSRSATACPRSSSRAPLSLSTCSAGLPPLPATRRTQQPPARSIAAGRLAAVLVDACSGVSILAPVRSRPTHDTSASALKAVVR
jgi:hypothetical protein